MTKETGTQQGGRVEKTQTQTRLGNILDYGDHFKRKLQLFPPTCSENLAHFMPTNITYTYRNLPNLFLLTNTFAIFSTVLTHVLWGIL